MKLSTTEKWVVVITGATLLAFAACVGGLLLLVARPAQTQALPVAGPTATPTVYQFQGEGDDIAQFHVSRDGLVRITLAHRGRRNFIVHILDDQGNIEEYLINDVGEYDGNKALNLQAGDYLMEINADGRWAVGILAP